MADCCLSIRSTAAIRGQTTGCYRPGGGHGDTAERIISLSMAEKFHFLVTNFTNCVIRQG
jgi:hypothetical protein